MEGDIPMVHNRRTKGQKEKAKTWMPD